jgi:serine hydrolase
MSALDYTTVVFVPGLRDHVADHWQTLLADELPRTRTVEPLRENKVSLDARVAALDKVLADVDGPVVLVAHSAGVLITAAWAQQHSRPITGALLATPPDLTVALPDGYPTREQLRDNGWYPTQRRPLPFPSILAASSNDPLARYDSVVALAKQWHSRLVDIGPVGHLNPAAGFGPWQPAEELVAALAEQSSNIPSRINSNIESALVS